MINISPHRNTAFKRTACLLAIGLLAVVAGCVQKYPISYYAAPGDTIVLGLGGIQRNTNGASTLSASDLTITLTNTSTQAVTTLSPGNGFKAFPDYSSTENVASINGVLSGSIIPFDGGWFVPVTLPTSSLPPGAYTISITSPTGKLLNTNWCYGPAYCEGDLTNIPLQIVSGSGTSNSGYSNQFSYYNTGHHLDVSPNQAPDSAGYPAMGGLQLVIAFPSANYSATLPIMAVPYSHNPSIQLAQNIVNNGDGTSSLVVLLTAPQGFVTNANRTPLTPVLSDLSLSFLFFPASGIKSNATQQLGDFKIDQSRSHYYDTSGNVIASLQPAMTFQ